MNKESFLIKAQAYIRYYNIQLNSTSACHAVLPKFDGKVLNARLTTAIKAANKKVGTTFSLENGRVSIKNFNERSYKINTSTYGYSTYDHIGDYEMPFTVAVDDNNRIDAAKSIENLKKAELDIAERRDEYQFAIENYDLHEKELKDLEGKIKEYDAKWSTKLRANISVNRR